MVRRVYAQNRQYASVNELKVEIVRVWESIEVEILRNLITSMSKRVVECIALEGKSINY